MTDETEKTAVRIDVSPTLHPDSVVPLGKVIGPDSGSALTASAYRAAQGALKTLYEGLSDMERANISTRAEFGIGAVVDGSSIHSALPDEHAARLAADMGDRFGKVAKSFDQANVQVAETISKLQSLVDRAITSPKKDNMAASAASDIRGYMRGLKDEGKRMDFIHEAIEQGDVEVVSAVLSTNPYISGLKPAHMLVVKDLASKKFAPIERSQLDAAQALAKHLDSASTIFVNRYKQIVPVVRESVHTQTMANLRGAKS